VGLFYRPRMQTTGHGDLDVTAHASISPDTLAAVQRILSDKQLSTILSALGGTPRVHIEALVDGGQRVASAHRHWQAGSLGHVPGLGPFARQQVDAITPGVLARVTCECVQAPSGGMSSDYGFRGHFVSLLVAVAAEAIWDARVETAT
jgi:hypothetical protein